MDTIKYKGKDYPTRTFLVKSPEFGDEPQEVKISVESLSEAMEGKYEENDTEEQGIDEEIYFYVKDEEIYIQAEILVRECLDVPMELIDDIS